MRIRFAAIALLVMMASCKAGEAKKDIPVDKPDGGSAGKKSEPAKPKTARILPYVFCLGGLTAEEIKKLKKVPGVKKVTPKGRRVEVVWLPVEYKPTVRWIKGAGRIYDFLAIKKKLGFTEWTGGRSVGGRSGAIFFNRHRMTWRMDGQGMTLTCYNGVRPDQVEHEMLRCMAGMNLGLEQYENGYVLVAREAGKVSDVLWLMNDQSYIHIRGYDKTMIAAYVVRLGSIIPKDYKVDFNKWVENEIRWRLRQIYKLDAGDDPKSSTRGAAGLIYMGRYLKIFFPELMSLRPKLDAVKATPQERWDWLNWARNWLWANRRNFKLGGLSVCVLKGRDLYDPENPPKLPKDIQGPPRPTEKAKPEVKPATPAKKK